MTLDPQDVADNLAAERAYEDMLAHPETVIDAFDLFETRNCTDCHAELAADRRREMCEDC